MDISQIDTNFAVVTEINKPDICFHSVLEAPFRIYGVYYHEGKFRRLPEEVAKTVSDGVLRLHSHTAGGRVRFRTDSSYIAIIAKMPVIGKMAHFALTGSAGFDIYDGTRYLKTFVPPFGISGGFQSVADLGGAQMRDITIHFPLYSEIEELYIGISEGATLEAPKPYTYEVPIVYYGSSITQGGCASRPGMAYENILSRRLDADHINLGFSGNAKGESEIAQYISGLKMSVFVYDYDHNSPSMEHYRETYEPMFRKIRDANPDLPIICMGRPQYYLNENIRMRLEHIRSTVENSRARGDDKVWMITGPELMALAGGEGHVDACHPTDLGFMSMANALEELLKKII